MNTTGPWALVTGASSRHRLAYFSSNWQPKAYNIIAVSNQEDSAGRIKAAL